MKNLTVYGTPTVFTLRHMGIFGFSMQNTPFHQANAALRDDLSTIRDDVVASLNAIASAAETSNESPDIIPPTSTPTANAVTPATEQAFLEELRALCNDFANAFRAVPFNPNTFNPGYGQNDFQGRGTGNGRGNHGGRGNSGRSCRYRRNLGHYCWSHGACNHNSVDCRNPVEGHQTTATFSNKMHGSNKYCRQADEATAQPH